LSLRFPDQQRRDPAAGDNQETHLMSKFSRALAITLLAASVPATIVVAQQADNKDQPKAERSEKFSPETRAALEDGRIAMAKVSLKLTPEQEKLWVPVEEQIRARNVERGKRADEWRAKRDERRAERDKRDELGLPERLERRSQKLTERAARMTERAAKTKEFAEALKPLYASLSEEQKKVAAHVLGRFSGDEWGRRGRHGHRWAMGSGRGRGHDRD
jgi:hypothetical protein